ncbi:hypothetical protein JCM16408A_25720 [Methylobacterium phyllosphaerae]
MAEQPTPNHAARSPGKINEVLMAGKPIWPSDEPREVAILAHGGGAATVDRSQLPGKTGFKGRGRRRVFPIPRCGPPPRIRVPTAFTFPRAFAPASRWAEAPRAGSGGKGGADMVWEHHHVR